MCSQCALIFKSLGGNHSNTFFVLVCFYFIVVVNAVNVLCFLYILLEHLVVFIYDPLCNS